MAGGRGTRRCALLALGAALGCSVPSKDRAAPDTLRIAVPHELDSIDPHAENKLSSFSVLSNVYEGLVGMDGEMRIQPLLAESWESPDPLTWQFRLRRGVSFQDGRPLQARDVVYSVRRLLGDPRLEMRSYALDVREVAAIDAGTIRIRTFRPTRILLGKLAFVAIVPEAATGAGLGAAANGTGPYGLEGWRAGESVSLRRNDRYWGRPPDFGRVEFALARRSDDALAGLREGRYQMVQGSEKRLAEGAAALPRCVVQTRTNLYVKYLGFDVARQVTPFCPATPNPFRDRRVRQALSLAVDREALVRELPSFAEPANQPLPRFVFGFDPGLPRLAHDEAAARALLRQAGLASGFPVTLHTRRLFAEAAQLVAAQLARVGIRVELRVLPDPEFFELLRGRGASLWLSRWGDPTGDAADLLEMFVHTPDPARQLGQLNYGGYSNADLDAAIEDSAGVERPEVRRLALQAIVRRVVADLVVVPLYIDQDVGVFDRSLAWTSRGDSLIRAAEVRRAP